MDAAAKLISERGFSDTRLSDISKIAGLPTSAIYYYYASREALFGAVMATGAAAVNDNLKAVLAALPASATPKDRLFAAVEAHLRLELEVSTYSRAIIRNANQLSTVAASPALELLASYQGAWKRLIEDIKTNGELRPNVDPAIAKMLILGSLNWAVEWFNEKEGAIEDVINAAQTMIWNALAPDAK